MPTKIISGTITGGYTLSSAYDVLSITSTGRVTGGAGRTSAVHGGMGGSGVDLPLGGMVVNAGAIFGGSGGSGAVFGGAGGAGVALAASGTVANSGSIAGGTGGHGYHAGVGGAGVALAAGGAVTNGGTIVGGQCGSSFYYCRAGGAGVALGGDGTVANSGLIRGGAGGFGYNQSRGVASSGGAGVSLATAGDVVNTGSIKGGAGGGGYNAERGGGGGAGVALAAGGTVANSGLITGGAGGYAQIAGGNGGAAVSLGGGGTVINNGSIAGGAYGYGAGGDASLGNGVVLKAGGVVVNGSKASNAALIDGHTGVEAGPAGVATVVNYGTIDGAGGSAIWFGNAQDRLIIEAGSELIGAVDGGGGTLELASATGTISRLGSGAIRGLGASLRQFNAYQLDAGRDWTLTGTNTIQATGDLTNDALLSIASGAALSVRGAFTQDGEATLTLAGRGRLALSGAANLAGLIDGVGTVTVANATIGDLTLGGTDELSVSGTVSQTGAVTIGDATTSGASLSIATGATWTIEGVAGIARGASALSSLQVAGTLIKSQAPGVSTISLVTTDSGLIEAAMGTLDFSAALTGTGALKIDAGAVLEADSSVASTLTATFNGKQATLALLAPTTFAATIAGLAVGDTIDLLNAHATGASVNSKNQLVIVDHNKVVASLQLTGPYHGATFTLGSDGHGGTDLTLASRSAMPSGAASPARSVQALVSAMAGLGTQSALAASSPAHVETWRPTLLAPRIHLA